jgi:hypothetical protein
MDTRQPTEIKATAGQTIDGNRKRPRLHDKTCDETTASLHDQSSLPLENRTYVHNECLGVAENCVGRKSPHLSFIDPPQEVAQDDGWVESCYGMVRYISTLCSTLWRS